MLTIHKNSPSNSVHSFFFSSTVKNKLPKFDCLSTDLSNDNRHMSRLHAVRECEYTQKTRTCTCYSVMIESQIDGVEDGVRFVFDATAG